MVEVELAGLDAVFLNPDLLFEYEMQPGLVVAAQLGADRDMPIPPGVRHAASGATVIVQLDSFPMSAYSARDVKCETIVGSRRLQCGWISAAPGSELEDKALPGCALSRGGEILASGRTVPA